MHIGVHAYCSGQFFKEYQHEDIDVGNYSQIGMYVSHFIQPDHQSIYNRKQVNNYPPQMIGDTPAKHTSRGKLTIGRDVWIGNHAVLFGGVTIGDGAIIGAYSVVAKDIPPYAIAVGNPCRVIKYRFDKKDRDALQKIQWYEWDIETVKKRAVDMRDIRQFVKKYGKD